MGVSMSVNLQENQPSGLSNIMKAISQINMQSIMVLNLDRTSMRSITQFQPEKTLKKLKRCWVKNYEAAAMASGLID